MKEKPNKTGIPVKIVKLLNMQPETIREGLAIYLDHEPFIEISISANEPNVQFPEILKQWKKFKLPELKRSNVFYFHFVKPENPDAVSTSRKYKITEVVFPSNG